MFRRIFIALSAVVVFSSVSLAVAEARSKDTFSTHGDAGFVTACFSAGQAAGLFDILMGEGPFTVFSAMSEGTAETCLSVENIEELLAGLGNELMVPSVQVGDQANMTQDGVTNVINAALLSKQSILVATRFTGDQAFNYL